MPGEEHHEFVVTVPAHTLASAPLITATAMPVRKMAAIAWMIPQGPSGMLGWRFSMGGVQVIPANKGSWLIRDGNADGAQLSRLPDSGAWEVTAYNTGNNPHSIYVSYFVDVIRPKPVLVVPFGLGLLQPGVDAPPAHSPVTR